MRQDREIRQAQDIEGGDRIWIPGLTVPNLLVEDQEVRTGPSGAPESLLTIWTQGPDAHSVMVEIVVEPDHQVWITSAPVGSA
jgi:hypothetical protein